MLADLSQILIEEWDAIPQQNVARLVTSMRRSCQAVVVAYGSSTCYPDTDCKINEVYGQCFFFCFAFLILECMANVFFLVLITVGDCNAPTVIWLALPTYLPMFLIPRLPDACHAAPRWKGLE